MVKQSDVTRDMPETMPLNSRLKTLTAMSPYTKAERIKKILKNTAKVMGTTKPQKRIFAANFPLLDALFIII